MWVIGFRQTSRLRHAMGRREAGTARCAPRNDCMRAVLLRPHRFNSPPSCRRAHAVGRLPDSPLWVVGTPARPVDALDREGGIGGPRLSSAFYKRIALGDLPENVHYPVS
jgi:hypothetical protein